MRLDAGFVRIDAGWTPAEALEVLDMDRVEHAVVHRKLPDGREYFYAYPAGQLVALLQSATAANITDALNLHEYQASPTAPVMRGSPAGTVVVTDGQIAGVVTSAVGGMRTPDMLGDAQMRGLVASLPAEIVTGDEASLVVEIVRDVTGTVAFAASTGDELDIVVMARGALALVGPSSAKLTLADADMSNLFKVRGTAPGDGAVKVMIFKAGVGIAAATVTTRVVAASTSTDTNTAKAEIHAAVAAPDLSVVILEDRASHTYTMRLSSRDPELGFNFQEFGPISLAPDAEKYFASLFDDIDAILANTDGPKAKQDAFEAKGSNLTKKIIPDDLRKALWSLRGRIETILIQSEEPWVPWEMCRLFGDEGGKIVEDGFLAEKFIVTRWFLGTPYQTEIGLAKVALVVPSDSKLLATLAEANYVRGLAKPPDRTVTLVNATSLDLRNALADGDYDTLHFSGHGLANTDNADRANIRLEQNRWFTAEDVCGRVANFGARHPFVMLNACQVGRAGTSLGSIAGWPQAFIRAGAAAFIGAFWSIGDGRASLFTQELYDQLIAGVPIGKAVHEARRRIRNAMDPTWLAYVVYAHPDAKVVA